MPKANRNEYNAAKIIGALLIRPGKFFKDGGGNDRWEVALGLMTLSGIFSAAAFLIMTHPPSPWVTGSIWAVNAIGMVFILATFGYLSIRVSMPQKISYGKLFSTFAFASSLPTFFSWIPGAKWITEIWRWWLIGIGLTQSNGLQLRHALLIMGSSIGLTVLLFWSFMLPF